MAIFITLLFCTSIIFNNIYIMADNFNVMSINVRGTIKNTEQRNKLLSCVQINNMNILLLQETHVKDLRLKSEIDKNFNCKSFWSFGSSDSKGVAVLIMNNFENTINKFEKDSEGRAVSVKISSPHGDFNIVSIYAPNNISERKIFLRNLDPLLIGTNPLILGGDWNMIEDLKLDKINGNPSKGNEGSIELNSIKQVYKLNDPFRQLYKDERSFTWSCESTGVCTRLDRFYINKDFNKYLKNVRHIHCNISDHLGVIAEFNETPNSNFKI